MEDKKEKEGLINEPLWPYGTKIKQEGEFSKMKLEHVRLWEF